jgi:hypothetical protein
MEDCEMEKELTEIHRILENLVGLHRQLVEVVRSEREALVSADLKAIQERTYAKEALIEQIRAQESARVRQVSALAILWRKPLRELTLPKLIIEVQGKDLALAEQFRTLFNTLSLLVQRIEQLNQDNRALVQKSLDHIEDMKRNVLGEASPKSNTYNPQGQRAHNAGTSRLISKEV